MLSGGIAPAQVWAQARLPLEVGLLPNLSVRTLMAQYQPMRSHLETYLMRPVQLSTAPSWSEFHRRVLNDEYALMFTAIHMARLAQLDRGYRPLVLLVPDIDCLLVTTSVRPLQSVAQLRGQSLVLSNPQSLVALRGLQWLSEQGLQLERDFTVFRVRTDDNAANVLLQGSAVAAMLSAGEFQAIAPADRSLLKIVSRFAQVPGFVVMVSPSVDAAEAKAIQDALLRLNGQAADAGSYFALTGFQGVRVVPAGLMESVQAFVAPTRELLALAP